MGCLQGFSIHQGQELCQRNSLLPANRSGSPYSAWLWTERGSPVASRIFWPGSGSNAGVDRGSDDGRGVSVSHRITLTSRPVLPVRRFDPIGGTPLIVPCLFIWRIFTPNVASMSWRPIEVLQTKGMKGWTTKEAKLAIEWARTSAEARSPIDEIAGRLGRSIGSVQQFLRRVLPRGEWPWTERPRWAPEEIAAVHGDGTGLPTRSRAAVKKYLSRCCRRASYDNQYGEELDRQSLTVTQVAADLGLSRASVYRLLDRGVLRRFKGGIAETSFADLLREHPEVVRYSNLPRDHKEWLVLNGYSDPAIVVKRPSVRGLLE